MPICAKESSNYRRVMKLPAQAAVFAAALLVPLLAAFSSMPGAYSEFPADHTETKAVAEFAVKAEAAQEKKTLTLVKVERAEKQIVAGTNYRLILRVRDGASSKLAHALSFEA